MLNKTPLISVIVPVYKVEKYLRRCVDSILAQTFTDFELLLVDDGSPDNSGKICDEYAALDPRVRVFHKPNGGVSSARNLGLDNARGEWIVFVDSDDWVGEEYLSNLFGAVKGGTEIVIAYATIESFKGSVEEHYPQQSVDLNDIYKLFEQNDLEWHTSPWAKLFKRSLIDKLGLTFEENMSIGEDLIFLFKYLLGTNGKIESVNSSEYHYFNDVEGSLTKRIYTFDDEVENLRKVLNVLQGYETFLLGHAESIKRINWIKYYYRNRVINSMYKGNLKFNKRLDVLKSFVNDGFEYYPEDLINKILGFLLINRMFVAYDFVRNCKAIVNRLRNHSKGTI